MAGGRTVHRQATEQVFVVVYPDPQNIAGLGIAYFDDADEAAGFAGVFKAHRVTEETVPVEIAELWAFTRWEAS